MLRRLLLAASVALAPACGDEPANPFGSPTLPPSSEAVLLFVSGAWAQEAGRPRELFALNGDGTKAERLTTCAEADPPCDFLQVAPSPERARLAAIRTTPGAEAGATALYFLDLSRAVEKLVFSNRRVASVDFFPDGTNLLYSAVVGGTGTSQADLFFAQPDGQNEQRLTETPDADERSPRVDPFLRTAAYEGPDESGVSRVYLLGSDPVTSGPTGGTPLPGTPYVVGSDADPVFSPDGRSIAFRRLTGTGNEGLGTWDLLTLVLDGTSAPTVLVTGPLFRGAPDWGSNGIVFVETDGGTARSQLVLVSADGATRTVLRTEDAGYRMGSPRWLAAN
jgi:hypothetical protein